MATGPEMLAALREATRNLPINSEFAINVIDAKDLRKLRPSHLQADGWGQATAERVSTALREGDFQPLGESMGLRLSVSHDAARLLEERAASGTEQGPAEA